MNIFKSNEKGPKKMSVYLDPDDKTIINLVYGATNWESSKVYYNDEIVRPTVDNGYYYVCEKNGKSSITEPDWDLLSSDDSITDGTIIWKPIEYNLWLATSEVLTNSIWTTNNENILLSYPAFDNTTSSIMIESIPSNLSTFILTNQVTKSNGEKISKSFEYKVNQQ